MPLTAWKLRALTRLRGCCESTGTDWTSEWVVRPSWSDQELASLCLSSLYSCHNRGFSLTLISLCVCGSFKRMGPGSRGVDPPGQSQDGSPRASQPSWRQAIFNRIRTPGQSRQHRPGGVRVTDCPPHLTDTRHVHIHSCPWHWKVALK